MAKATDPRRIQVFDTTLRDGEQAPGCSMNLQEKLRVAEHLERLRVDVIEAGFAIASPGDFESVRAVARAIRGPAVASLARARAADIDAAWEAVREARRPRIHTFLATSPIHRQYKLKMSADQVCDQAATMVRHARNLCPEVEFSLEDASRTEPDFVCRVVEAVIRAGAGIVNLPDTVGYAVPEQYAAMIRDVQERVPNAGDAILSVHCHDDLGLAVANTLAAVRAGAQQVECAINGIGERAGNAALEEVAMALRTRADCFGVATGLDTTQIYAASRCVTLVTGCRVQPNKAIVGENAFAHEAGIHQHGMMAHAGTYEIMTPASIGIPRSRMVLGKHSGRHAFEERLSDLGFAFDGERVQTLFDQFKQLADRKKTVSDADIEALARGLETGGQMPERVRLERFNVQSGNVITATSTVRLVRDGATVEHVAAGDGPIDASFRAINHLVGLHPSLEAFSLSAVTGGEDAQGEATVKVRAGERLYNGHGLSTDVIEASIRAYLAALNAILNERPKAGTERP